MSKRDALNVIQFAIVVAVALAILSLAIGRMNECNRLMQSADNSWDSIRFYQAAPRCQK